MKTKKAPEGAFFAFLSATAAAEENKKSDYDDPNAVVIVKKVAETVVHS